MVSLNIDLGELPDEPVELYSLAHRVNVACGGHAGDAASMRLACRLARTSGARLGAHPSFEDRENFGRVAIEAPAAEIRDSVERQCRALREIAESEGVVVKHMKPHGALYHSAAREPALAVAVIDATLAALGRVEIVGPPDGGLRDAAERAGVVYVREGFADRRYLPDGRLAPRGQPGALIHDPLEAAAQARELARAGRVDTICVHGDTLHATLIARAVRVALGEG